MSDTESESTLAARAPSDPFYDLDRWFDGLERRFNDAFVAWPFPALRLATRGGTRSALAAARTDVQDTGAAFRVRAEVPGIPKERIDIRVRGTSVEIRGEAGGSAEQDTAEYVHRERWSGGFYRAFELPEPVVAANAKARVQDGVLELELPKQAPTPKDNDTKVPVE